MLGMTVALIVISGCGYLIVKDYKPQAVLLAGGFIMMAFAILFNFGPILPAKQSSGFIWFDIFTYIENLLTTRTANLGILIMSVAGFARYMDKIGASDALVNISIKPLRLIKSPYVVLAIGFFIGQLMHMVIPSASGLGLVLMVTMYPIFIGLGVSKTSATAVIGTNSCLDLGPASANTVLAAKMAGLPVVNYFMNYQLPVGIAITVVIAIVHFFVQRWFDNKYDGEICDRILKEQVAATRVESKQAAPAYYALLPLVPLTLIIVFGYLQFGNVKMDIVSAMFIGLVVGIFLEIMRQGSIKKAFAGIQSFFDGMGVQFATVVTLIVAGETFAKGLTSLGAIDTLIKGAENLGLGKNVMIFVLSGIIAVCTIIMGSGNAPFFAFAAFAPEVASNMNFEAVNLLLPMQLSSSVARSMSPITAVIVAICGISKVSPFAVIKRTALPMMIGLVLIQVVTLMMFG